MTPINHTFHMYQGQTFADELLFTDGAGAPIDLSAKSARMQVRTSIESPTVIIELTTANTRIVLTALGVCRFNVTAEDTGELFEGVYEIQQWVYDLEFVTPGSPEVVERVRTGAVVFWPQITRP